VSTLRTSSPYVVGAEPRRWIGARDASLFTVLALAVFVSLFVIGRDSGALAPAREATAARAHAYGPAPIPVQLSDAPAIVAPVVRPAPTRTVAPRASTTTAGPSSTATPAVVQPQASPPAASAPVSPSPSRSTAKPKPATSGQSFESSG
jgi:hypothetical protein